MTVENHHLNRGYIFIHDCFSIVMLVFGGVYPFSHNHRSGRFPQVKGNYPPGKEETYPIRIAGTFESMMISERPSRLVGYVSDFSLEGNIEYRPIFH